MLASPPVIGDQKIDYRQILEGVKSQVIEKDNEQWLYLMLSWLGDPNSELNRGGKFYRTHGDYATNVSFEYIEQLLDAPYFAAEASPLRARTLLELINHAAAIHLIWTNHDPVLVLIGDGLGLVAIRSMTAVGGALWDGAQEEVKEFGGDASAQLLDMLRKRLNIKRRKKSR